MRIEIKFSLNAYIKMLISEPVFFNGYPIIVALLFS